MISSRRKARELAMQTLFYLDMGGVKPESAVAMFCQNFNPSPKFLPFYQGLVEGVISKKAEIDALIERFSSNWKISRMSGVDRNVLRVAVYEMLFCDDIPPKVSINEAIDVGKKYGTEESGAFINGILDSIHLALKKQTPADTAGDKSQAAPSPEQETP
jgi:N utilization substance protein B